MFYVLTWSYILHVCFAQTCVLDVITCLLTLLSLEMGEEGGGGIFAFDKFKFKLFPNYLLYETDFC